MALAQVLAMRPKLILMDEPFASLDAIVRARVVQDVVALVEREGISVLLVTHDLEEAISLSDEVYLLSQGPRAHHAALSGADPAAARSRSSRAPIPPSHRSTRRLWADLSREVDHRAEAA